MYDFFALISRANRLGEIVVLREDVKRAINLDTGWFDDVLTHHASDNSVDEIVVKRLVEYMNTGDVQPRSVNAKLLRQREVTNQRLLRQKADIYPSLEVCAGTYTSHRDLMKLLAEEIGSRTQLLNCKAAPSARSVSFGEMSLENEANEQCGHSDGAPIPTNNGSAIASQEIVRHKGTYITPIGGSKVKRKPGKPLWRKQEVVRQERIVHYTTVDGNGEVQELVETERSSTEVTHMECNETGEFAHRETSEFEQLETFNKQIVSVNQGNEEYVHLKSTEDEIEYMESNNMPNRQQQSQEQQAEDGQPKNGGATEPERHDNYFHGGSSESPNYSAAPGEKRQDCADGSPFDDEDFVPSFADATVSVSREGLTENVVVEENVRDHIEAAGTYGSFQDEFVTFYDEGELQNNHDNDEEAASYTGWGAED